jgi:hypothetical protein
MARAAVTEARIAHIAGMMRRLAWRTGESAPELAADWKLSRSAVEKLSAEASRRVRAELADPGEVTTIVTSALARVLHDALAAGDRRNAIRAAETWARIAGAVAPPRRDPLPTADVRGVTLYQPATSPAAPTVWLPEEVPE